MNIIRGSEIELTPASHEDPAKPGVLKKILFKRDDLPSGVIQMINWSVMPVGETFRNHYHDSLAEVFIITKGKVSGIVEGNPIELSEGDAIFINAKEKHTFTNTTEDIVLYIALGILLEEGGKTVVVE